MRIRAIAVLALTLAVSPVIWHTAMGGTANPSAGGALHRSLEDLSSEEATVLGRQVADQYRAGARDADLAKAAHGAAGAIRQARLAAEAQPKTAASVAPAQAPEGSGDPAADQKPTPSLTDADHLAMGVFVNAQLGVGHGDRDFGRLIAERLEQALAKRQAAAETDADPPQPRQPGAGAPTPSADRVRESAAAGIGINRPNVVVPGAGFGSTRSDGDDSNNKNNNKKNNNKNNRKNNNRDD